MGDGRTGLGQRLPFGFGQVQGMPKHGAWPDQAVMRVRINEAGYQQGIGIVREGAGADAGLSRCFHAANLCQTRHAGQTAACSWLAKMLFLRA